MYNNHSDDLLPEQAVHWSQQTCSARESQLTVLRNSGGFSLEQANSRNGYIAVRHHIAHQGSQNRNSLITSLLNKMVMIVRENHLWRVRGMSHQETACIAETCNNHTIRS